MRILTIGCGLVGSVIARDIAETLPSAEMTISDSEREKAERIASTIGKHNVHSIPLDVSDYANLVETLEGFDLAIGLTPGRVGYDVVRACIRTGLDIVDLSYMREDPFGLNEEAIKSGITVIPDCGIAPGLSNILVGRAAALLDSVRDVRILVGGIPERPVPPLDYKITWCAEDLVEEYLREAKIVKEGRTVCVAALDGLEYVNFPGIGRLESFYTDGVRTLHHTLKGVENMWEKTMRYPGHAEKIKLLIGLGLFDESPIEARGVSIVPRDFTTALLEQKLSAPEIGDLFAMNIEVTGTKGDSEFTYTYSLLDRCDEERKVTAMARITAHTASIIVQLLARGEIEERGVIPPERLGMKRETFDKIMTELKERGTNIAENVGMDLA